MSGLTQRESSQAYELGKAARRGQKRITDCPFRGSTPAVRLKADEWCRGFADQNDELARRTKA